MLVSIGSARIAHKHHENGSKAKIKVSECANAIWYIEEFKNVLDMK
jgi:hypothetical protein